MKAKDILLTLTLLIIPIALVGCGSKTTATPTTNPDLIYTAAAQTADVRLTQIFQSTPSATTAPPTPTLDLTQTAAAQTDSAMLTQMAAVTLTPQTTAVTTVVSTATTVPSGPAGDRAVFVSDVTIPDGTVLAPGATFVKTWKLQNGGTTTWTTGYTLGFISGDQMGTITSMPLAQSVAPGQQVDVSVSMVAPNNTGKYQGYWKMKNAAGQLFNDPVYVLINVGSGGVSPTTAPSTPGATAVPTATGTSGNPISSLSMSVDEGTYLGQCPHTFTFAATFTLSQGATLTYGLQASSDTPGFQFSLPSDQTSTFGAGTYTLSFPLTFTSSGTGWVRFHVSAPVETNSNQASFNLTCTP
jgi:Ig-like domain from next to BRCA1 gene